MNENYKVEEVLKQIGFLLKGYSNERRSNTQPFLLSVVERRINNYNYEPEDILIRETLLEHVGSLPVVATTLYPYLCNKDVNLGEALIMLAVHDIGELITGDTSTFTKRAQNDKEEFKAGLKLLHPDYHAAYKAVESISDDSSPTAKFAKSVDKITPDIIDYLTPAHITKARLKHFAHFEPEEIVPKIIKFKRPYMEWDTFMTDFHIHLMDKLSEKLNLNED